MINLLAETAFLINPCAPLFAPLTKVGTVSVIGSFKVISVKVWTSYNEIFHSFTFPLLELYDPDSNLKSYTLARPISLPGAVIWEAPTLSSLKLKT